MVVSIPRDSAHIVLGIQPVLLYAKHEVQSVSRYGSIRKLLPALDGELEKRNRTLF